MNTVISPFGPLSLAPADVLLLTITREETEAVLAVIEEVFPSQRPKFEHTDRGGYIRLGSISGAQIVLTEARMGDAGPGSAQDAVTAAVLDYRPKVVIALGIAYGVDPVDQAIGDILISETLFIWNDNRVDELDGQGMIWSVRGDKPSSTASLFSAFVMAARLWNRRSNFSGKVHQGTFASGNTLVNSEQFRTWLQHNTTKMIGGEMEGRGVYGAALGRAGGSLRIDWIIVKGICDWASRKDVPSKIEDQRLAAQNAARFVVDVLSQGNFATVSRTHFNAKCTKTDSITTYPVPHLRARSPYRQMVIPPDLFLPIPENTVIEDPVTICTVGRDENKNSMVVVEAEETQSISRVAHISISVKKGQHSRWEYTIHPRSMRNVFLNKNQISTPHKLLENSLIELPLTDGRRLELIFGTYKTTLLEA